ncbi:MAG: biopolymer transporter ExbD [Nitrospirota bacterium]
MEEKEFDYINVIPFVDIMLVLLTIVLTTSTFIVQGIIPVELPKASKSEAESLRTQIIEIDKKGNLFWNSNPITLSNLFSLMKDKDKNTPILIRADRNIALQTFVDVLDAVKSLGFKRVSLQTEEKR